MNHSTLEAALGLSTPWKVTEDTFSLEEKRLDITLDFEPGRLVMRRGFQMGRRSG